MFHPHSVHCREIYNHDQGCYIDYKWFLGANIIMIIKTYLKFIMAYSEPLLYSGVYFVVKEKPKVSDIQDKNPV